MSRDASNDLEVLHTLASNLASESFFSAASKLADISSGANFLRMQQKIYEEIKRNHAKKIEYFDFENALGLIQSLDLLLDGTINSEYLSEFFTAKINSLFEKKTSLNQQRRNLKIAAKMLTKLSRSGLHHQYLTDKNQEILQKAIRKILQNLEEVLAVTKEGQHYASLMMDLSCEILSHIKNSGLLPLCGEKIFSHIARICDVKDLDNVAINSLCSIATNYEQVAHKILPDDFRKRISQLQPQSTIRISKTQKQIFDNLTTYLRYGDMASKAANEEWKHQAYRSEKRDFIRNIDGRYYAVLEHPLDDLAENFADIAILKKGAVGQRDEIVVVLEVDGPNHYCNIDGKRIPNGRTIERDKLRATLQVPFVKIEEGQLQNFGSEIAAIAAAAFSQISPLAQIRSELASLDSLEKPIAVSFDSAISLPQEAVTASAAAFEPQEVKAIDLSKAATKVATATAETEMAAVLAADSLSSSPSEEQQSQVSQVVASKIPQILTQPLTKKSSPETPASSVAVVAEKSGAKKKKLSKSQKDLLAILNNPEFDFDLLKNFLKKHYYATNPDLYCRPIILRGELEYGGRYIDLVEYAVSSPHINLFLFLLRCLPSEAIEPQKILSLIGPYNTAIALIMKKASLLNDKILENYPFVAQYLKKFDTDCAKIRSLLDSRVLFNRFIEDLKSQDWKTEVILRRTAACRGLNLMMLLEEIASCETELLQFALLGATPESLKRDINEEREPHRARVVKGSVLDKMGQKVDEKSGLIYQSLLVMAIKRFDYDQINFLLELGVNINSCNEFGKTALITAVSMNDLAMVRYLVEKCQADVNCVDARNFSALEEASARGYVEILQYLLDKNATPKIKKDGKSLRFDALLAGAVNGKIESLKVFFANGYRPDYIGAIGDSLLSAAIYNNDANVIKFLLPLGAAINYPAKKRNEDKFFEYKDQKDGCNIFLKICCVGNKETLALFQPPYQFTSEQMHASDLWGNNAFHLAAEFGNNIVEDIYKNFVASFGMDEAQKSLVQISGSQSGSQRSFLSIALEKNNDEMCRFFLKNVSPQALLSDPRVTLGFLDLFLQKPYRSDFIKKAQEIIDYDNDFTNRLVTLDPASHVTPLFAAGFIYKNKDMVEFLCRNNADLGLESSIGSKTYKVIDRLNTGYEGKECDVIIEVLREYHSNTTSAAAVAQPAAAPVSSQHSNSQQLQQSIL